MTNFIVSPEESARKKRSAEVICRRLNELAGHRIANPEYKAANANRAPYYTGGVVLSERGAKEIADKIDP